MAPQRWSVNSTVQVFLNHGKTFAVEGLPLEVSEKESSKILACLAFQFVFFVLHAPRARLRRLVCCFLSVANHCSGAIPCHNHCMFVALCVLKKKIFTRMRRGVQSGLLPRTIHQTELNCRL